MFLFILLGSFLFLFFSCCLFTVESYRFYSCSGEYFGTYLPIGDWIFLDLIGSLFDWIEFGVDLSLIGLQDDWI